MTSLVVSLLACGQEDGKTPTTNQMGGTSGGQSTSSDEIASLLVGDEQLASDNVSNNLDDAITDVLEGAESRDGTSGGFALLDNADRVARVSRYRECQVVDQKAVVSIKRSLERERTFGKFGRSGSFVLKQLLDKSRSWSKEGGTMSCASDGKHAQILRPELQGVTLVAKYTREHLQSSTFENSRKNIKVTQSRRVKATGERTVKWTKVVSEGDSLLLTKEIQSSSSMTFASLNKKGETKTFETTVTTDQSLPLVVVHERNKVTDKILSHTIVSGKKIATHKSGARVETSFSNVKYAAGDGCYASSGKIEGAIYPKDATSPSATFIVDFAGESKTLRMTKADGTVVETDYVADGCDMDGQEIDESAGNSADKSNALDVNLKI